MEALLMFARLSKVKPHADLTGEERQILSSRWRASVEARELAAQNQQTPTPLPSPAKK
ncbi:hypothetical protein [Aeromicrobium sp. 179-A 4D2 NHS]|uniref:hypothetical protein n=1 Tax=Aeromicrobium sp. 179-A 4D2 NHS TaxID=3142375 RepID=UPI0039A2C630